MGYEGTVIQSAETSSDFIVLDRDERETHPEFIKKSGIFELSDEVANVLETGNLQELDD